MKLKFAGLALAAVALTAACTTTVTGSAGQVPGQTPVKKPADPCALLTPEQAEALNLEPQGELTPGKPEQLLPPNCTWTAGDPDARTNALYASWTEELSLEDYILGALPSEKFELGGLTWTRYASILGKSHCDLLVPLGEKSFAQLSSYSSQEDESKACDLPKRAAPLAASHLEGGDPSPTLPTPSRPPVPSGPLVSVQPCTLLTAEQATSLQLTPTTVTLGTTTDIKRPPGCEWDDVDGDGGVKALDVYVGAARPVREWPLLEEPGTPFEAGGKKWELYPDGKVCSATLPVTETSSVMITSGNLDDPAKNCDLLKAVIPLLSAKLPA
jgi:hypothetical protein